MVKIILIVAFLLIISSLGTALYHLVNNKAGRLSPKVAKALTVRIGLSILLFFLLFVLVATGVVKPHGIGSRMHPQLGISGQNPK